MDSNPTSYEVVQEAVLSVMDNSHGVPAVEYNRLRERAIVGCGWTLAEFNNEADVRLQAASLLIDELQRQLST